MNADGCLCTTKTTTTIGNETSNHQSQEGYSKDAGIWIAGHVIPMHEREQIARNDGLTLQDWDDWFADYDKTEPLAIIHFTKFRY